VGGGTLAVYTVTAAKELVVAHTFGTSDSLDAFLIAMAIPTFAVNVAGTSIQPALIPVYLRARAICPARAQRFLESTSLLFLGLLALILAALGWSATRLMPLLASGFSPAKLELTGWLFLWLLPVILVRGIAKLWGGVLNAGNRFSAAALAPVGTPALIMSLVFIPGLGIRALVIGTVAGAVVEAALVGWPLARMGVLRWPGWHGLDSGLKEVMRQYLTAASSTLLMAAAVVIDQMLAATLKPGSVAVLSYGTYVVIFLQQIASVAVITVVLPNFARLAIASDHGRLKRSLGDLARMIVFVTVPVAAGLVLASRLVVRRLFEHGNFSAADAAAVSDVQVYYALQIPFYVLNCLVVRCLVALCRNSVLLWGALVNLGVKLALNCLLMPALGVRGIALSTSAMYMTSVAFHYWRLRKAMAVAL
jgi:putative peptidoglycan lipid II flippase